ncbi:unnamed protein product [Parnassius mnemosyne]|uniref:Uncharacterized protein n=1 Tax=Parnassius mnemosyne TaxID=213953 RepID=A0AAV1LFF6_9NEOP
MVQLLTVQIIVFIAIVDVAHSLVKDKGNKTSHDVNNHVTEFETRRKSKTDIKKLKMDIKNSRSTSSSSGEKENSSAEGSDQSLELSSSSESASSARDKKKRNKPKSSKERTGWRKWHRNCPKCPEDMAKKWRDPSIQWICGAYQRARRTFKSKCMMIYRNCQDGTMFVEIYKGRCQNDSADDSQPHGDHFFYEYNVILTDDSSDETKSAAASSRASGSDADY